MKAYFGRKKFALLNEENELIKFVRDNNLICHDLKMRIEHFQMGGLFACDRNLFLPSLLLIHFFFEKNCYFGENRVCRDRTAEMTEPEYKMSDEEVKDLLVNLGYDTNELNRCIKEVYESEKNKNPCEYPDVWVYKQELFNDWIDRVTCPISTKSARKV